MDTSTKARGKETKRRKTRGTFSLKQVKQIRSTPLATDYRNSSVLVIRAHSRTKEFPGTCPALAGWLALEERLITQSVHTPEKPLLLVLGWAVALGSLAFTWYTFKLHWRKGADFRQAQELLIYFAKCFCCMSHILLYMAINIGCFGPHKKSLRKIKQILSKGTNNKHRKLSLMSPR